MGKQFLTKASVILKLNICKNICLLLLLLLVGLKNSAQDILINDSISTFGNNLNPNQTLQQIPLATLRFTKAKNRRINFGFTGCEYHYIICKLSAPQTLFNQYLSIDNTSLDTVNIYRVYENGIDSLLYRGGLLVPFNKKRNYVWHTIPLVINENPSYYCIAVKASQKIINLQYEINDENSLLQKYQGYERVVFFFMGIAFMISAIITLAFFLFKKRIFAAYLAYMLCISAWIIAHYGRIFPCLHPQIPVLNEITKPLTSLGAGLFLLIVLKWVFAQNLRNEKLLSKLIEWTRLVLLMTIASMLLLLFPRLNPGVRAVLNTLWHIELLLLIALVIFIPFHFITSGSIAKIFSLAMLVICVTVLIQLFANVGFVEDYFVNEHGMALGTLLENSIMAFGLFYGLLEERKNKELQVLALEAQQTDTLKKLIAVQDKERTRIAGDLHDNIGPLLAALKINFRRIVNVKGERQQRELVQKTEGIIDDSIIEIRNVAHNLMPKNLSSDGLINTLSGYFEDMEQLYGKKILFNHEVQSIVEPELQMNIYRIVSELVMNAAKHSDAEMITASIYSESQLLSIFIKDNGHGFDLKRNGSKKSLGIQSAESRVDYLKGKFILKSEPGKGTSVNIKIPL
ncbi:MAG: 7TM diverse intracellular signaling domain-containing protein [Ginsengibacter sp.]